MVLQRLFDIILTLAKSSLALRGHREDLSQEGYHGNFLSFVELVAQYDHILWQVLDMPKGSTRYLSTTIQNEMIESLGTKLETHLLEQIRASPFFAIIMDTTQDISKVDQLSIVVSVLKDINYVSKTLQKCDINLGEASKALAETKGKLQIYRNDFELFKCKASETARKYGIDTHLQEKRQRKVKKHFDELAADHRFPNREEIFKVEIFNNVLDTLIAQLNTRFTARTASERGVRAINFNLVQQRNISRLFSSYHEVTGVRESGIEKSPPARRPDETGSSVRFLKRARVSLLKDVGGFKMASIHSPCENSSCG
ncbi:52 kDa repressor of the inhibitor of the protein kinase [Eumeta japonica]|uniref:52 kDa repressor of the inhibitor of the protein kinase n=1 Tax=Eumeta variegata TaxID=151549 RepID=A0A4C1ZNN9_EUMVA|nr:52 kDa repressor of the inhibitor of the protein kinase [Eumeta japonica]